VRGNGHGVFADRLQRAVGQANLRLGDREAVLRQCVGDVGVGDRAEQATIDAGLLRDADDLALKLFANRLCGGQLLGAALLELDALDFELLDRRRRGNDVPAGRDQEIARVAVLDLDDVAQLPRWRLFQQMICMGRDSSDLVLIAVRQQCQEARTLDAVVS